MDYSTHDNENMPIQEIVYGNFLREEPCLRLLHLKSLQRQLNKLFSIGQGETCHNLIYACQTSVTSLNMIDVLGKLKAEILDLEYLHWLNNFYKKGEH